MSRRARAPSARTLAAALKALDHLPAVLKALEVLNGEQRKLREQMSAQLGLFDVPTPAAPPIPRPPMPFTPPAPPLPASQSLETLSTDRLTTSPDPPMSEAQRARMAAQREWAQRRRTEALPAPEAPQAEVGT